MNMIITTRMRFCTDGVIACIFIDEYGTKNAYNFYHTLHYILSTILEIHVDVASQSYLVALFCLETFLTALGISGAFRSKKSYAHGVGVHSETIEDPPWRIGTLFDRTPLLRFLSSSKMEPKLKMRSIGNPESAQ